MNFLEIAVPLAERGFRVFPLIPKTKRPVKMGEGDHFDWATTDREQLELWAKDAPNANVGLCPDENFCFLETDSETELKAACDAVGVPAEVWTTARVSSGRPDRCYYIFRQTMRTRAAGNLTKTRPGQDNLFEFKQHRVYVTGPGSIHPITGQPYVAEWRNIGPMPDALLNVLLAAVGEVSIVGSGRAMNADTEQQTTLLDKFLETFEVVVTGAWFNKGKQWYRPIVCPWEAEHENQNQGTSTCVVYTEGGGYGFDCKHRCAAKDWKTFRAEVESHFPGRKFSFAPIEPAVKLGESENVTQPVTDKPALFHSKHELLNAPPLTFLIDGFLPCDGATAIAAPVGMRKTLIALNIARSLLTGEPLFGHFKVTKRPSRILYLVPEVGLSSFTTRLKKIGLLDFVGDSFLCRTMNSPGALRLSDAALREYLPGAVVFLDTAVRFMEGKENESSEMRRFADDIFALMRDGAESVVLLHHSSKGTQSSNELTLDNAMRGSGELAAFLSTCWATRLQDPTEPYKSASYLVNVKQRDFESRAFEIMSTPEGHLNIVPGSEGTVTLGKSAADDEAALAILRANPADMSERKIQAALSAAGIKKGRDWIRKAKFARLQENGGRLAG